MNATIRTMCFALVAAAAVALTGCSDTKAPTAAVSGSDAPQVVDVSVLKANPDKYLGPVVVKGMTGQVYANDGVVEIGDQKGCCNLYLFVPFTDEQNQKLRAESLYQGEFPAPGTPLEVECVLSKVDEGYRLDVIRVDSHGKTLLTKKG